MRHPIESSTKEGFGINEQTLVTFGDVWKVTDLSNRTLVTTSGRLNTSTLEDTVAQTIQGWQNRQGDFSFDLNGTIVAILHPDNSVDYEGIG